MSTRPDFEATCTLMRDLGFSLEEAKSTPEAFGSWFINGKANGKPMRVVWDGRDGALIIQLSSSGRPDDWDDRWLAGAAYGHKPSELREGLLSLLKG